MIYSNIWKHIVQNLNIDVSKKIQYISSSQIKQCKNTWNGTQNQFEPRLLCKMDTSNSRPSIFRENNIYLLSVKNGLYALLKNNIYSQLQTFDCVQNKIYRKNTSLLLDIGNSESTMLDNLLYNGVLDDIIGERIKYGPLLSGRHRCSFETIVGDNILHINGSQYETDGCYETDNYVCIIEAKTIECNDFNIRQLYYPFREIHKTIGNKKQIIALFIYRDRKQIIHIYKYKWNNYKNMLDMKNIGYYQYIQL